MASKKTLEERLSLIAEREKKAQEKIDQMKARRRMLEKKQQDEARRARTRRLIQIGAAAESVLGREFVDGDLDLFLNFLKKQERNGSFFSKAMEKQQAWVRPVSRDPEDPEDFPYLDGGGQ